MDYSQYKNEYRSFLLFVSLFTQIRQQIGKCMYLDFAPTCLSRNKYLSIQANYMVIIWIGLSLLWRDNTEKSEKLMGRIQGALVGYITLVMLAYWALLSATDTSVGWDMYTNIVQHYVIPIGFIFDWLLYEKKSYSWSFLGSWLIYPIIYIVFLLTNGALGLDLKYIYPFLDPVANGWNRVIFMLVILVLAYILLSCIFIGINKLIVKEVDQVDNQDN